MIGPKAFILIFLACCSIFPTFEAVRSKRHPKSRQRAAADGGECILGYKQRIEHHCRYPSTEQPCFHQADDSEAAVEEAAKKCCQSGLLCSTNDFEGLCCRTMECLQKCYGPTFFQRFRDRGFKYLDILLRPHPNHRSGRDLDNLEKLAEFEDALSQFAAAQEEEGGRQQNAEEAMEK